MYFHVRYFHSPSQFMNILLIQQDNLDLYSTLAASETSRMTLRFYHPEKVSCGVLITTGSLGSALSLVSEIRWYIRRYCKEVLFGLTDGIYATKILADHVYQREIKLEPPWEARFLYVFQEGHLRMKVPMAPGTVRDNYADDIQMADQVLEVWSLEELEEKMES
jgi:hypothetical protein